MSQFVIVYVYVAPTDALPRGMVSIRAIRHTNPTAPNRNAVARLCESVLQKLSEEVAAAGGTWAIPHVSSSENGEDVLEWWRGERKVTLYVSEQGLEYIKVWGFDIENDMESGRLRSARDFRSIWTWLHS